jgi:hypothetical protein
VASEEELGSSIPTVFLGDITMIFQDAVRIRRNNHYGVLHTKTSILQYILVYTNCLGRVVKGESGVQSHSDLDGVGSIPAIPNTLYVPSLLCHEQFNEASLPSSTY